jgi:hypothetical protein
MASANEARATIVECLSIPHHRDGLPIPAKGRPHVRAAFAKPAVCGVEGDDPDDLTE